MAEPAAPPLGEEVEAQIRALGEVGIVVGIPTFNTAHTVGQVVRAASAGLAKYFPESRTLIVVSDGGSTDGTPEAVRQAGVDDLRPLLLSHPAPLAQRIVTPYHGIPGKGSAFRTIFEIARRLNARACGMMDSDLRSATPEWVELLIGPVLTHGYDYVTPLYARHKYDGTITNSMVYPLTRALYGKRIRQPIGGDFGLSGALAARFLKECTGCIELLHNVIGKMIRCARETKRDRMPVDACPLRDGAWFGPLAA